MHRSYARFVMTVNCYILSVPHSGSTLLSLLLGSHPQVVSGGEIRVFPDYWARNDRCTCRASVRSCAFWSTVGSRVSPRALRASTWSARVSRRAGITPRWVRATRRLTKAMAEVASAKVVVDSSKSSGRIEALIDRSWRVLFLIRDGRAFIETQRRRKTNNPWPPERSARQWADINERALRLLARLPDYQHLTVRYEDLCTDPKRELAGVCDWLSVPFDDIMLDFRAVPHHDIRGNIMRFGSDHQLRLSERWREDLSDQDLASFREHAGLVARRLGYL
jgi:hypothetical protein